MTSAGVTIYAAGTPIRRQRTEMHFDVNREGKLRICNNLKITHVSIEQLKALIEEE